MSSPTMQHVRHFGHEKPFAPEQAFNPELVSTRLDNGLTVVVLPDMRSSAVTHMVWYKNGAIDDPTNKSGIAHFLEHLMFKGTRNVSAPEFAHFISRSGGAYNAFTSWSYTSYFEQISPDLLAKCMAFEADRMANLDFDDEAVRSEREVVLAERGMTVESNPSNMLQEAMLATCFGTAPQGRPIIGWRDEIEGLTTADAAAYYRRFYAPGNAVLVVAGDVVADDVIALAKQHYGTVPPGTPPAPRLLPQLAATSTQQRVSVARSTVREPEIRKMFRVPAQGPVDTEIALALELVAFYLAGSPTGHLPQSLTLERQLAVRTNASYWGDVFPYTTVFFISAMPAPGVSLEDLEIALDDLIRKLAIDGISPEDLARCKRHLEARALFALDDPFMVARHYGTQLCLGQELEQIGRWQSRLQALTVGDIRQAFALLDPAAAVTGYLLPENAAGSIGYPA